ncbi:hypothetical protein ABZT45_50915, partial [Streptomyces sp. NPDC005356]|uniref:hypothetical protein n=1 Tax=Streptomyces sp. NPDC005356 TaxID=3157167 RepID=UPI0033B30CA4
SGLDQQAGTRRPTDPGTALERTTCLDRFDRFRVELVVYRFNGSRMVLETLDAVSLNHRP